MPISRESNVTAIQDAKDLKTLSLDQLLGHLITHKMMLWRNISKKNKEISLEATMVIVLLTKKFKLPKQEVNRKRGNQPIKKETI